MLREKIETFSYTLLFVRLKVFVRAKLFQSSLAQKNKNDKSLNCVHVIFIMHKGKGLLYVVWDS